MKAKTNGCDLHRDLSESCFGVGYARSIAQHGELFQGQIEDRECRRRRCLVSLPCKEMYSEATFEPSTTKTITIQPPHKLKAKRSAELTCEYLKVPWNGGSIRIESTVPEAKGYGSSTADCVAATLAVADAANTYLTEEEVARLVVKAEVASDNFMFQDAVLFAHRDGIILERFAPSLPRIEVIGVDTAEKSYVHTLEYPPAVYSRQQLQSFRILTGALRYALRQRDVRLLGRVATASATINEHFLPKPLFKDVVAIGRDVGAVGVAVAHSGTVLSVLFDPQDRQLERGIHQLRQHLCDLGISKIMRFKT